MYICEYIYRGAMTSKRTWIARSRYLMPSRAQMCHTHTHTHTHTHMNTHRTLACTHINTHTHRRRRSARRVILTHYLTYTGTEREREMHTPIQHFGVSGITVLDFAHSDAAVGVLQPREYF
jgi:hypothetical protein